MFSGVKDLIASNEELKKQWVFFPDKMEDSDLAYILAKWSTFKDKQLKLYMKQNGCGDDEYDYYSANYIISKIYTINNEKYFKEMIDSVCNASSLSDLNREQFMACVKAFQKQLHFPCLCGLLSIFDYLLNEKDSNTSLVTGLRTKMAGLDQNSSKYLNLSNLLNFVSELTKRYDFSKDDEPLQLNRHWVLHGRTGMQTNEGDCLKIFCSIKTLLDNIEVNSGGDPNDN